MGMRLAIALIPVDGEVKNAPNIYKATLCCIFLSTLKEYDSSTLL